ncbi:MAG: heme-binding protein, partial [Bacteroidetes bacterium]|nr:heme-binding protein [Bacteroidota bacterium]
MKWIIIITVIIATVLVASQIYAMSTQNDIETYTYKVVKTYDRFEIRTYD